MTKQHFVAAAEIISSIRAGQWTHELPEWAPHEQDVYLDTIEISSLERGNLDRDFVRAVWTAEAFIHLFQEWNPRFNEWRFLAACGLV